MNLVALAMRKQEGLTPDIIAEHGLSPDEYQRLVAALGREPRLTELGIFSVMWSEHCSYKSSKVWLKKLPTEGPQVIQGPGENAGVIRISDEIAVTFKRVPHAFFGGSSGDGVEPNVLALRIQPEEGISLKFEAKVPGQIRSVLNVQEMVARALLLDTEALAVARAEGDVLAANQIFMDAFYTDVRRDLAGWREERGLPADPMAAYAASGYQQQIEADRVGGNQAGWN